MADIRLGTSAFTAAGWPGTFYPKGLPGREYLTYYATKFDTVEVDSTFYRTSALTTVKGWYSKTPKGFGDLTVGVVSQPYKLKLFHPGELKTYAAPTSAFALMVDHSHATSMARPYSFRLVQQPGKAKET
jgi:Protein of unknown function DUF72